ncbi:probable rRNA maturation factor [Prosthecobacter debontii]|uniref:Endoribonuclease YbeY n=1 Tax=Prosthecobacter debontii TaxID=48467 RepID=A0A1T4YYD0_9BACT|nr:rRNA maturation RNase YbeY [Prosthecobacter debontii]SKB06782.1 probable rRNA maturation factor [Prosthecobacter debontii]
MAKLSLYNRQKTHRPDLPWLRRIVKAAFPLCLAQTRSPDAPLHQLEEIEITIISDEAIAEVHAEFLDDPTPTDVITFHHGEILVSADTALRQGSEHGQALNHELALYMIHGLMHLGGWDDHEAEEAAEMAQRQQVVLESCLG